MPSRPSFINILYYLHKNHIQYKYIKQTKTNQKCKNQENCTRQNMEIGPNKTDRHTNKTDRQAKYGNRCRYNSAKQFNKNLAMVALI